MTGTSRNTVHFPGLNGLRAIAAMTVVIGHIDQFSTLFGVKSLGFYRIGMAGDAVDLFFVLSGFLITSLLLHEKAASGTVAVRKFYLRRILRIWPTYFLALGVGVWLCISGLAEASGDLWSVLPFYLLLIPNIGYGLELVLMPVVSLWSIGVEEQFYLVWPQAMLRARDPLRGILGVLIGFELLKSAAYLLMGSTSITYGMFYLTRIDNMCIGGLGAYWVYTDARILRSFFNKGVQVAAWGLFLCTYAAGPFHFITFIDRQLLGVLYLVLILNVAANPATLVGLERGWLDRLGRISYGLYVYHILVIHLLAILASWANVLPGRATIFLCATAGSVLVAQVSYRYFESIFLRKKERYEVVKSSPDMPPATVSAVP